jgi:cell pole-organizing protein PopZ
MSNVADASEPSMQDILASIRKIISDEDPPEDTPDNAGAAAAAPEDVFEEDDASTPDISDAAEVASEDAPDIGDSDFDAIAEAEPEADPFDAVEPDADLDDGDDTAFNPPDDEDDELLELTPDMALDQDAPLPVEAAEDDIFFDEERDEAVSAPEPEPEMVAPAPIPEPVAPAPVVPPIADMPPPPLDPVVAAPKILSDTTDAAVGAAFGQLNSLLLSREARTVEDLIRDMLQPMLKGWLDDNLPGLVEKIVREEIERVSRGR